MRRRLHWLAFVRKQNVADGDTNYKHDDERDADAAVPRRSRTNSPQLLVQKFLVALIHLAPSGNAPYETRGNWPVFPVLLSSPIYQFGDAATNLIVEDLFYAVRVHAFIMHQCLELVFQ
jgi:hypothetical protein